MSTSGDDDAIAAIGEDADIDCELRSLVKSGREYGDCDVESEGGVVDAS